MNYGILLAAGSGTRIGLDTPKQFLKLGDQCLLEICIEKFLACEELKHIVVVASEEWFEYTKSVMKKYENERISLCVGGDSRQESLKNGLIFLKNDFLIRDEDVVVTHDVARPFVTLRMIRENIDVCKTFGAADTVMPVIDTIVESTGGDCISQIPLRSVLYLGQTPQTFFINSFLEIYKKLSKEYLDKVTDAAKILQENGVNVGLVKGDYSNFKITTQFDLNVAKALIG